MGLRRLEPQRDSEELQRALEGELVGFLRQQNSKLMDELAYLRSTLDGGSNGKATSGMETSPWSEVDGSADSSRAFVGSLQPENLVDVEVELLGRRSEKLRLALGEKTTKGSHRTEQRSLMVHHQKIVSHYHQYHLFQ